MVARSPIRPSASRVLPFALLAFGFAYASPVMAEVTPEQKAQAEEIDQALDQAAKLSRAKSYKELGDLVVETEQKLVALAAGDTAGDLRAFLNQAKRKLGTHRKLAEKRGGLAPLGETPVGGVSFVKEIAPLIVNRCGNCHVQNARGMFSMATYDDLMRGPADAGRVITPGMGKGSRLIDVLESGDMPRGGGKLPDDQIAMLVKWIDAGAAFDGPNRQAPLLELAPPTSQPQRPTLEVVQATGKEKVLFSRDIAPVLIEQCIDCHGVQQPRGNLGLDTFRRLLNGGDTGAAVAPGDPSESLLVKKLKGTAGDRMPLQSEPLPDETIAKIEAWIADGAKFDGSDATMQNSLVVEVYKAKVMEHKALAARRLELGLGNWRLGNPEDAPRQVESENFLVLGKLPEERLKKISKVAEEQRQKIARLFKAPSSEPLIKGRITLFVFERRFEYGEYAQMVESRELPSDTSGHWRYNVIDAYACILLPSPTVEDADEIEAGLIAAQVAGAYIDSLGTVPRWFAEGSALAVAAKAVPKDPRVERLDESLGGILKASPKADAFLTGGLPAGDLPAMNYAFVKFLMSNATRYGAVLKAVKEGAKFDDALRQYYGGDATALATAWAPRAG